MLQPKMLQDGILNCILEVFPGKQYKLILHLALYISFMSSKGSVNFHDAAMDYC